MVPRPIVGDALVFGDRVVRHIHGPWRVRARDERRRRYVRRTDWPRSAGVWVDGGVRAATSASAARAVCRAARRHGAGVRVRSRRDGAAVVFEDRLTVVVVADEDEGHQPPPCEAIRNVNLYCSVALGVMPWIFVMRAPRSTPSHTK